jgi:predicted SprT family Zn-dependent metalloprotease
MIANWLTGWRGHPRPPVPGAAAAGAGPAGVAALRDDRLAWLTAVLARECPGCRVRLNRNTKTMLSLRGRKGGSVVSVHVGLLDHPEALSDIPGWVASHGRRTSSLLRQTLQMVWRVQRREQVAVHVTIPDLETIPLPFDLTGFYHQVHATWFPHLSRPTIGWARSSPKRNLSSIRFGCYHRRPHPAIIINPRLARPWVARIFFEHVLYHELCHHAQAQAPIRGEPPHSRRFREWEAQYPHHELAAAWERAHLDRFLSG